MISLGTIGAAREALARLTEKAISQRKAKIEINDEKVSGILAESADLSMDIELLEAGPSVNMSGV